MSNYQKFICMGRLGRDPELRTTQGGSSVCSFSVAVSEKRKQGDQWVDHAEWFNILTFGKVAENCHKYLSKGSQCLIDGKVQQRKWQDKEGKDRYTTEILANTVQFIGGKKEGQGSEAEFKDKAPDYDDSDSIPF